MLKVPFSFFKAWHATEVKLAKIYSTLTFFTRKSFELSFDSNF